MSDQLTENEFATPGDPKGRWWQFSIRTLLITATIFAACASVVAHGVRSQQQAVAVVQRVRGHVDYAPSMLGNLLPTNLSKRLSTDLVSNVVSIELSRGVDVSDADFVALIKAIEQLPHVTQLTLYGNHRQTDDLQKLAPLKHQLRRLKIFEWNRDYYIYNLWGNLGGTPTSSKPNQTLDLSPLASFEKLETFSIGDGEINERAFTDIANIRSLRHLTFNACQFKGEHLLLLRRLTNLNAFTVNNSHAVAKFDSYLKTETGELKPIGEPHFEYEQVFDGWREPKSFPEELYRKWMKKTLPGVVVGGMIAT